VAKIISLEPMDLICGPGNFSAYGLVICDVGFFYIGTWTISQRFTPYF